MRTDLDHLKPKHQRELQRVVDILCEEFEHKTAHRTGELKNARLLHIILFGSFARGTWVEDHLSGYRSDFDILVIVNQDRLTDVAEFWNDAEDRLMRDPFFKREVSVIFHTLDFVNDALGRAKYFFVDIYKDGIELYRAKAAGNLKKPGPLSPKEAYEEAKEHFEEWFPSAVGLLDTQQYSLRQKRYKDAAFLLHQVTERLYNCLLLVLTNYTPDIHNIKKLRSLCESRDDRLIPVWPRATRKEEARFNRLKDAYVKARYSKHYRVNEKDLLWLGECVKELMTVTEQICQEHLTKIKP